MLLRFIYIVLIWMPSMFALSAADHPYDGFQAGLDAYQLAEERRRDDVARQLAWNDQARAWSGWSTTRGETIYFGADYAYAYGRRVALDRYGQPMTLFEPWPYVPGDIYGYRDFRSARQPVGQWQVQMGPNRWKSHPVYDPPVTPSRVLPPTDSRWLDRTPFAEPRSGPREF